MSPLDRWKENSISWELFLRKKGGGGHFGKWWGGDRLPLFPHPLNLQKKGGALAVTWICGCISAAYMASSALAFVTCIPRVDSTTMSMVLFMYANEVGAEVAFDEGTLLRPSTR